MLGALFRVGASAAARGLGLAARAAAPALARVGSVAARGSTALARGTGAATRVATAAARPTSLLSRAAAGVRALARNPVAIGTGLALGIGAPVYDAISTAERNRKQDESDRALAAAIEEGKRENERIEEENRIANEKTQNDNEKAIADANAATEEQLKSVETMNQFVTDMMADYEDWKAAQAAATEENLLNLLTGTVAPPPPAEVAPPPPPPRPTAVAPPPPVYTAPPVYTPPPVYVAPPPPPPVYVEPTRSRRRGGFSRMLPSQSSIQEILELARYSMPSAPAPGIPRFGMPPVGPGFSMPRAPAPGIPVFRPPPNFFQPKPPPTTGRPPRTPAPPLKPKPGAKKGGRSILLPPVYMPPRDVVMKPAHESPITAYTLLTSLPPITYTNGRPSRAEGLQIVSSAQNLKMEREGRKLQPGMVVEHKLSNGARYYTDHLGRSVDMTGATFEHGFAKPALPPPAPRPPPIPTQPGPRCGHGFIPRPVPRPPPIVLPPAPRPPPIHIRPAPRPVGTKNSSVKPAGKKGGRALPRGAESEILNLLNGM
jgi:hypothetical protein